MTTINNGKLVTIGNQTRFFPAVLRNPVAAYDAKPADDEPSDVDEREEAMDAREADLDWREAASDEGKEDDEAKDRKAARDARAIARDKRAHDRRGGVGARDGEESDRDLAYRLSRDSETDHRSDFAPLAAGGSDSPAARDAFRRAADSIRGRAADSRRGVAFDAKTRELTDIDSLFRATASETAGQSLAEIFGTTAA
jgi:hypothetical protein